MTYVSDHVRNLAYRYGELEARRRKQEKEQQLAKIGIPLGIGLAALYVIDQHTVGSIGAGVGALMILICGIALFSSRGAVESTYKECFEARNQLACAGYEYDPERRVLTEIKTTMQVVL